MLKKIIEKRDCGLLRLQAVSKWYDDFEPALRELGFLCHPDQLQEIDKKLALSVITNILWRDLAYESEMMPLEEAKVFANTIMEEFCDDDTSFYTNGTWVPVDDRIVLKSWNPLANSTFDSGVIFVNKESCFCVWVEDED